MQYYDDNERGSRRAGAIAAAAYVVLCAALMFVEITLRVVETGEGILIDLGDTEQAGGRAVAAPPSSAENSAADAAQPSVPDHGDMMTQDIEDAPELPARQPEPERRPTDNAPRLQQQTAAPAEEQQRRPDPNALFPGTNRQGGDVSQGAAEGAGRQGSQEGTPGADPAGTGTGMEGAGFSLAGRSIVGSLPQPRYGPDKSGRVVVDITVDAAGKVIRAVPRGQGSTTNDSELVSAAVDAAGKARFNLADGDGLQTGTITYNFILK